MFTRQGAVVSDHEGLIPQHIPRLRRYARALTGDRNAADDLVQDTLERALSRLHLWRQGSDLRAWLFTIMHNIYVNQTRSRIRHPHEALDESAAEALHDREPDWGELRDIDDALSRLPGDQRAVLLLVTEGDSRKGYECLDDLSRTWANAREAGFSWPFSEGATRGGAPGSPLAAQSVFPACAN